LLPVIADTSGGPPFVLGEPAPWILKMLQRIDETWGQKGYPVDWIPTPSQRRWEYETTVRLLTNMVEGSRILDAGGGSGYISYILSDYYNVLYNDRHDAYSQPPAPLQKIIGSFFTLLTDGPLFDAIACVSVLEHVLPEQRAEWFIKMYELLRPGGVAVLTFEWHPTEMFDVLDGLTLTTEQLAELYSLDYFHVTAQLVSPTAAPNSRGWVPVAVRLVRKG
jgi:SAM-dependent methyltransferase